MKHLIIIGAGAAGLSAALYLAKQNISSILVSELPSERAQASMAEGGINAAIHTDGDSPALHAEDTIQAGRYLGDAEAIRQMTAAAPAIVEELMAAGMTFTLGADNQPAVRAFGGQRQKRTVYADASTGKQLMYTLIRQVRQYEEEGLIERRTGWQFLGLIHNSRRTAGCAVYHPLQKKTECLYGSVIMASGGLNGLFGNATGSVKNTGYASACLFASGVPFANGEFIQYHPTTVRRRCKHMLITEAVRGEGGRLYIVKQGKPCYFMEEKYPEMGNLMPRDVVSREEWALMEQGYEIYLDMRGLDDAVYEKKLASVVHDCQQFLSLDPRSEAIPVQPGIHYFMGGILVDLHHRTALAGLYAAGECACQYHGANRLGGNSLLGAVYGGKRAAQSALADWPSLAASPQLSWQPPELGHPGGSYIAEMDALRQIVRSGLSIIRTETQLQQSLQQLHCLWNTLCDTYDNTTSLVNNLLVRYGCLLSMAMVQSALARKESRGAHWRSDFPYENDRYRHRTVAVYRQGEIHISFEQESQTE